MVIEMYEYEESIESTMEEACKVSKAISNSISKYFKNEELIYNLRLVITELVVNGVEHGNGCNSSKRVIIKVELINDKIIIKVKDEGQGVDCNLDDCKIDFERTCGRGLFIVKKLTNSLKIIDNEIVAEIYI